MDFLEVKVDHQRDMEGILVDNQEKKIDHKERIVGHLEKNVNDDFVPIKHLLDDTDINLHDDILNEVDHLVHLDQDKKKICIKERSILLFFVIINQIL